MVAMLEGGMLSPRRWRLESPEVASNAPAARVATIVIALLGACLAKPARASITVLVGEPYDTFGTLLPIGHATIYLDRICADGPLRVRMCEPGESPGVALSRYNHIGPYDWMATPIMQFLYATSRADEAMQTTTPNLVDDLRQQYRHDFLGNLFPDDSDRSQSNDEWWESVGMAYSRRLWGYQIATTRSQDEQFVAMINARPNHHRYSAYHRNCANFAADMVNFYYPGLVKRNRLADLGFLLPKQVACSVYLYGKSHPGAQLKVIEIPQVPGTIPRSHTTRGGAETFLKTKRYVVPLTLIQPEIVASLLVVYLDSGRWSVGRPAEILKPESIQQVSESLLAKK